VGCDGHIKNHWGIAAGPDNYLPVGFRWSCSVEHNWELLSVTDDNDLIRRDPLATSSEFTNAYDKIKALPAVVASQPADPVRVTVKPLVWDITGCADDPLLQRLWIANDPERQASIEARRAETILAALDVQPDPRDAQIAALVEALDACIANIEHADMSDGVCCCGDNMDGHSNPMSCGHAPVDMGEYYAHLAIVKARAALAAVKGGDA
jgi:hypothetical protein